MIADPSTPATKPRPPATCGEPPERYAPDLTRAEATVRDPLAARGGDPDRPGLRETPRRAARVYRVLFSGAYADPAGHLKRTLDVDCAALVVLRDIEIQSSRERPSWPFTSLVNEAYLPRHRVVVRSKPARGVDGSCAPPRGFRSVGRPSSPTHSRITGIRAVCW